MATRPRRDDGLVEIVHPKSKLTSRVRPDAVAGWSRAGWEPADKESGAESPAEPNTDPSPAPRRSRS
ncbi:hypothetical protein N866_07180 [Actinotalea ferrariae CF5-4]|uniref:Uncharacterized protein n=1 Tax=Actinotalea ferrariae CF5-4 TaxID=948458 RepID=A0A021VXC5_9CELL|nr:hypothetical protein [Actinotalea ferrariae]EYR64675.1 hypothetical protein N866_07180 [Actinotalea ferrariae CF5-4]